MHVEPSGPSQVPLGVPVFSTGNLSGRKIQICTPSTLESESDYQSLKNTLKEIEQVFLSTNVLAQLPEDAAKQMMNLKEKLSSHFQKQTDPSVYATLASPKTILDKLECWIGQIEMKKKALHDDLCQAIRENKEDEVDRLIQAGAEINTSPSSSSLDESPFELALNSGNMRIVQALLPKVDINAPIGILNQTPLHIAASLGLLDIIKVLIAHGARVNVFDFLDESPLQTAINAGKIDVVKELIARGANVDASTLIGKPPLHTAVSKGSLEIVTYLVNEAHAIVSNDLMKEAILGSYRKDIVEALFQGKPSIPYTWQFFQSILDQNPSPDARAFVLEHMKACVTSAQSLRLPNHPNIHMLWSQQAAATLASLRGSLEKSIQESNFLSFIQTLKTIEPLKDLFEGSAQVGEGYTVEQHTKLVFDQLAQSSKFHQCAQVQQSLRRTLGFENFDINKFMFALIAFHDIGKSVGQTGQEQHIFTTPILPAVMKPMGFTPAEIQFAQTLVDNDILGEWQKGVLPSSVVDVAQQITTLSDTAHVSLNDYFQLQHLLYMSDASSYPSIREAVMQQDLSTGQWKFKPEEGMTRSRIEQLEDFITSPNKETIQTVLRNIKNSSQPTQNHQFEHVCQLFDTRHWGGRKTVFSIADEILSLKEVDLQRELGAQEAQQALDMAHYCKTLQADGYKADHAEWSVRYRIRLREHVSIQQLNGLGIKSAELRNLMLMPNSPEKIFYQILSSSIHKFQETDVSKVAQFTPAISGQSTPTLGECFFSFFYTTNDAKCHPFKLLSAFSRKSPIEQHVWTKSPEVAFRDLSKLCQSFDITEEQAREAFAALQAYTVEFLDRLQFPGKNTDGTVDIVRTEDKELMDNVYRVAEGSGRSMPRSALDCGSIGTCVTCFGEEITHSKVPFHRIVGGYFLSKDLTMFGADTYHGITFQPDGIPFEYVGALAATEKMTEWQPTMTPLPLPLSTEDKRLKDAFGLIPFTYVAESGNRVKRYLSPYLITPSATYQTHQLSQAMYDEWAQKYEKS